MELQICKIQNLQKSFRPKTNENLDHDQMYQILPATV